MSQETQGYPALTCELAGAAHVALFGPAPFGYAYECTDMYDPVTGSWYGSLITARSEIPVYRAVVQYGTPLTDPNDAVTTHDYAWSGQGEPEGEDFEGPEDRLTTFLTNVQQIFGNGTRITGIRWYKLKDDGTGIDGPSIRFTELSITTANGGELNAPQVACSVTQETSVRKRWGRFYLPFIAVEQVVNGRLNTATVDLVAVEAKDLEQPIGTTWFSIVYSSLFPHFLPVQGVRVDNVLDIIRSRRWRAATVRNTYPVNLP